MNAPHRASRCGGCYWALYDGDWCQNRNCVMSGKSVEDNRVMLTNEEALILISRRPGIEPEENSGGPEGAR